MDDLLFEPLYFSDRLHIINPAGDVGIVTLWSPFTAVERKFRLVLPHLLDPDQSRVVAIANLYGDGMYAMFCNLLYNPQVRHLVAVGEGLGLPVCAEIEAFLAYGLEDASMLGQKIKLIKGTKRAFPVDAKFDESRLRKNLSFKYLGKLSQKRLAENLARYIDSLPSRSVKGDLNRIHVRNPLLSLEEKSHLPSQVSAHQVVRSSPLDCWEELVVRCVRFGHPVQFRNGPGLELLNVKAVMTNPQPEPEEVLARYGFQLRDFNEYQRKIVQPGLPEDVRYTYGNRLRDYYPQQDGSKDTLRVIIDGLRLNLETRRGFIALWDSSKDLATIKQGWEYPPCLTTLFFRHHEGTLQLSATFRSHDLLAAWLENVYGLMAVQRHVADALHLDLGSITLTSHSLSIDLNSPRYQFALEISKRWRSDSNVDRLTNKRSLYLDPNGYFVVSVDTQEGCIVADHRLEGMLIKRYKADTAARIEREIIGDMAVSVVSHALWLGRELASKEQLLLRNRMKHPGKQPRSDVDN